MNMHAKTTNRDSARLHTELQEAEAHRLAEIIRAYWAKRGHKVTTRVFDLPFDHGQRCKPFAIASDMVNGLPRGYQGGRL